MTQDGARELKKTPEPDLSVSTAFLVLHTRNTDLDRPPPARSIAFQKTNGNSSVGAILSLNDFVKDPQGGYVSPFVYQIVGRVKEPGDLTMYTHKSGPAYGNPHANSTQDKSKSRPPTEELQGGLATFSTKYVKWKDKYDAEPKQASMDDKPSLAIICQDGGNITSCLVQFKWWCLAVRRIQGGGDIWVVDCAVPPIMVNVKVFAQVRLTS